MPKSDGWGFSPPSPPLLASPAKQIRSACYASSRAAATLSFRNRSYLLISMRSCTGTSAPSSRRRTSARRYAGAAAKRSRTPPPPPPPRTPPRRFASTSSTAPCPLRLRCRSPRRSTTLVSSSRSQRLSRLSIDSSATLRRRVCASWRPSSRRCSTYLKRATPRRAVRGAAPRGRRQGLCGGGGVVEPRRCAVGHAADGRAACVVWRVERRSLRRRRDGCGHVGVG